jgi:hypothetical protein
MPMLPQGEDAMNITIAGMLPTLTAPLTASVAALSAKETMFSGEVTSADSAYQNGDDTGGQSVGQLGQMGQQAGAPAQALSGQAGMFGSMMQQAMQAAQGGGASQNGGGSQGAAPAAGGQSAGGWPAAGQGVGGGAPQQPYDDSSSAGHDQAGREQGAEPDDRVEREEGPQGRAATRRRRSTRRCSTRRGSRADRNARPSAPR